MNLYSTRKLNKPITSVPLVIDMRDPRNGYDAPFTMAVTSTDAGTTAEVSISYDDGETYIPWAMGSTNQHLGKNVARLDAGETPTNLKVERKAGVGSVHFTLNR